MGWDIGGVNTKAALVVSGQLVSARTHPFELQRDPDGIVPLLRGLSGAVGATRAAAHAVTMTAELSQMFRTKREGVGFVLDAVDAAFPQSVVRVYTVDGRFLTTTDARADPLAVAAANWAATARAVAMRHPDALLIDVGTTTADVVPLVGGRVVATGWTDLERLGSGELVYTGVLRSPAESIANHVSLNGCHVGVSAEGFALAGDAHLWRGQLVPEDYTVPTPDGRPATREYAAERLARLLCGDREMLDEAAISVIADAVAHAQVARLVAAIRLVLARHPSLRLAVVAGLGSFLASAAAHDAGLGVMSLSTEFGDGAARCAPAASVGLLLEQAMSDRSPGAHALRLGNGASPSERRAAPFRNLVGSAGTNPEAPRVETVVKIGGGLLAFPSDLHAVLAAVEDARDHRVLIVPGGGPFANAVRDIDRVSALPDDVAHWMAVLAMDQYAHLLVSRLGRGALVREPQEILEAFSDGRVPVLAPYQWLRRVDPLPHTWEVTSDSIAAWVSGAVGASGLVLVKPPGACGPGLADAHFPIARPPGLAVTVLAADQVGAMTSAVQGCPEPPPRFGVAQGPASP